MIFETKLQIWHRTVSSQKECSNHMSDKHPWSENVNVHALDGLDRARSTANSISAQTSQEGMKCTKAKD